MKRKKSIVYGWALSYMLILLVPITISIVLYISTSRVIADEIINSNMLLIKQLKQKMESILSDTERMSIEIAFEPNVEMLSALTAPLSDEGYYTIANTAKKIQNFNISSNFIKRFYIYAGAGINMIVAPSASYPAEIFYQLEVKEALGISFEQWHQLIRGNYSGEFVIVKKEKEHLIENGIYYFRSLPILHHSEKQYTLIIEVDTEKFLNEIKQSGILNQGNLVVLDSSNKIIFSSQKEVLDSELLYEDLKEPSGIQEMKINGEQYVAVYSTSEIEQWKYAAIIPKNIFHRKLNFITNITLTGIVISLVLGGVIIYFAIHRNYNPVKALLDFISGNYEQERRASREKNERQDEFSLIRQAISRNNLEKKEVRQKLIQQNRLMKSSFLAGLLQGRDFEVPMDELLAIYEINFDSDRFAVMAVAIEENSEEDRQLDEFILQNVLEELINENNIGYMTKINELQLCIVNTKAEEQEELNAKIRLAVLKAREFISANYNIRFSVAVSNMHNTLTGIPVAFNEAIEAMEYTWVLGNKELIFYREITKPDRESYYYPIDKEYQMLNCIKAGDFKGAKQMLEEVFEQNFKGNTPSLQMVRCLMFELIGTTMKAINRLDDNSKNSFLDRLNPVEDLIKCVNINQMMAHIDKIMYEVCEYVNNAVRQQDFKIRDRVHEIVGRRYDDPCLDIPSIAGEMLLNPSYLSRIYKEQTGGGLLEYINAYRIKVAAEFLKSSGTSLEEVAYKTGFSNLKTFTRAFKKYEGITPGKYNL